MPGMVQVPFGQALVSRIEPAMGAHAYKTYGMAMPLRTHWRSASCDEYGCDAWRNGWVTTVDLSTDLGRKQAEYIRHDRTRRASEQRSGPAEVKFVFGPGQRCFRAADHRAPLGRPPRFVVTGGDWRGNPRGIPARVHRNGTDWCEDFAEHQDKIASAIGRG